MRIHFYNGHIPLGQQVKMSKVRRSSRKSGKVVKLSKLAIFKLNKGVGQNGQETV